MIDGWLNNQALGSDRISYIKIIIFSVGTLNKILIWGKFLDMVEIQGLAKVSQEVIYHLKANWNFTFDYLSVLVRYTGSQKCLQNPNLFQKVSYKIFKIFNFSTDWLTDPLTPSLKMPSGKRNSITAMAIGLIFLTVWPHFVPRCAFCQI